MSPLKRNLLFWGLLIGLFLGTWQVLAPSDSPSSGARRAAPRMDAAAATPPDEPLLVLLLVGAGLIGAFTIGLARQTRPSPSVLALRAAESLVLDERYEEAEAALRVILARTPLHGAEARVLLGRCAEGWGDFVEAAEIYAWAKRPPSKPLLGGMPGVWRAVASVRRAFVLAILGRLDEADEELASSARDCAEYEVVTAGLVVRARALVLAKRQSYRDVLDVIGKERALARETLGLADRELLRVLEAYGHLMLSPSAHRASAPPSTLDACEANWIFMVFPEARSLGDAT